MKEKSANPNLLYQLITIPSSHFSEKARWALDWVQIPYTEERHVPVFHRFATRRHGGTSVPVLVTPDGALVDSTDILRYLNTKSKDSRQLFPIDPELRPKIDELEELFDTKLGANIVRWVYFYRLNDRQSIRRDWCEGTPAKEQWGFDLAFPFMRRLVRRDLNVTADAAKTALQEIEQIFATVSQQLEDGRRFLVGDRFSAADLTFAALSAPVLLPPEHPMKILELEKLDREMVSTIEELRSTPAGKFALRLYRENRLGNG